MPESCGPVHPTPQLWLLFLSRQAWLLLLLFSLKSGMGRGGLSLLLFLNNSPLEESQWPPWHAHPPPFPQWAVFLSSPPPILFHLETGLNSLETKSPRQRPGQRRGDKAPLRWPCRVSSPPPSGAGLPFSHSSRSLLLGEGNRSSPHPMEGLFRKFHAGPLDVQQWGGRGRRSLKQTKWGRLLLQPWSPLSCAIWFLSPLPFLPPARDPHHLHPGGLPGHQRVDPPWPKLTARHPASASCPPPNAQPRVAASRTCFFQPGVQMMLMNLARGSP